MVNLTWLGISIIGWVRWPEVGHSYELRQTYIDITKSFSLKGKRNQKIVISFWVFLLFFYLFCVKCSIWSISSQEPIQHWRGLVCFSALRLFGLLLLSLLSPVLTTMLASRLNKIAALIVHTWFHLLHGIIYFLSFFSISKWILIY